MKASCFELEYTWGGGHVTAAASALALMPERVYVDCVFRELVNLARRDL